MSSIFDKLCPDDIAFYRNAGKSVEKNASVEENAEENVSVEENAEKSVEENVSVEENAGKSVEKNVSVEENAGKSVEKILYLLKNNPHITQKKLVNMVGLSRRGVEKNISILKAKKNN